MGIGSKVVKNGKKEKVVGSWKQWENLRKEIMESPKNYNKLVSLLKQLKEFVNDIDEIDIKEVRALLFELEKIFKFFISKGLHKTRKNHNEQEQTVRRWINAKYEEFYSIIFQIWNKEDKDDKIITLKLDTLDYVFNLLCEEAKNMNEPFFPTDRFRIILNQLLHVGNEKDIEEDGTMSEPILNEFKIKYFNKYWDLKFYFYQEFININKINSIVFAKFLTITKECEIFDLKNRDSITEQLILIKNSPINTIYNFSSFRLNFEKSWIFALNKENNKLDRFELLATLNILHKRIIPFFSNAQKLMDFLTVSYTIGLKNKDIIISILSLNGLWELMKTYNLEYPDFYKNLYKILTPDLLHLNEKSRFFRLLELFMSSTHLSSSIIASFIKKLSRLSLTSPPSGIILIVPFIYNLIKKYGHSTCILLLQSTTNKEEDENYNDPFNLNEEDPSLTLAIESSIWELETMINHYHPNISSLIKILHQKFTKIGYNMEDFLDFSYEKLIKNEINKKLNGNIGLEFEKWDSLFNNEGYLIEYLY